MAIFELQGGPLPYQESVEQQLALRGHRRAESSDAAEIHVVYCAGPETWVELQSSVKTAAAVAVLADLDIAGFATALAMGAGAVHIDNSTHIIADAVEASLNGEALLALGVAQELAAAWKPRKARAELNPFETQLSNALVAGQTQQSLASTMGYSDRTVRRKLQGLYLKLGVENRNEAIQAIQELRL